MIFPQNSRRCLFQPASTPQKRIPWASEPGCQSCHTGDVLTTIAKSDPNVIPAKDGIRLLQAYRTNDATVTPISSPTSRFAENQVDGKRVLYRLSKDNHAGIFCQGCHGSTHAEWPVKPASGTVIANDNQPAIQLQGHAGKIIECNTCHFAGTLPLSLGGPHGLHPIEARWVGGHEKFLGKPLKEPPVKPVMAPRARERCWPKPPPRGVFR